VWKQLVCEPITEDDVNAHAVLSFKILETIRNIEKEPDITPELFNQELDLYFTTIGSDQKTYPLVPGGGSKKVTWENRLEFASALKKFRLEEFRQQCEAMRRGLATVVPYRILSLFTWRQLELECCGRPDMDIDLLEQNTNYDSCSKDDPHIQFFWKMIREKFDNEERAAFLSFVWGRRRLPLTSQGFDRNFKISRMSNCDSNPDSYLPVSHTCFFSLDLPKYSSLEVMHQKMLYAITHCVAIDADDTSNARAAAQRTVSVDDAASDDEPDEPSLF